VTVVCATAWPEVEATRIAMLMRHNTAREISQTEIPVTGRAKPDCAGRKARAFDGLETPFRFVVIMHDIDASPQSGSRGGQHPAKGCCEIVLCDGNAAARRRLFECQSRPIYLRRIVRG
jgi:hypothetical protein